MRLKSTIQQIKFWHIQNLDNLELAYAHHLNHTFPYHFHEEYIIGIIVQGVEEINYGGRIFVAPTGSLILINPGEAHSNYTIDEKGFTYRTFYPSTKLLKQLYFDFTEQEGLPVFSKPVLQKSDLFRLLLRLHINLEQTNSDLEQESVFISVMAQLIARHALVNIKALPIVRERRFIKIAREYLEANYADNFSLCQLASVSNISRFHLLRTFHEETGLPPFEYQTQLRVSRAKKLLRDGWSIADVAAETGFVDQSHLTKHFKRIVGLTPGKYSRDRSNIQYSVH